MILESVCCFLIQTSVIHQPPIRELITHAVIETHRVSIILEVHPEPSTLCTGLIREVSSCPRNTEHETDLDPAYGIGP